MNQDLSKLPDITGIYVGGIAAKALSDRMRALGLIADAPKPTKKVKTPEEVAAFRAKRRAKQRECMKRLRAIRRAKALERQLELPMAYPTIERPRKPLLWAARPNSEPVFQVVQFHFFGSLGTIETMSEKEDEGLPNFTQVPNVILDKMAELKPADLIVFLVINRHTLGRNERWVSLSYERLQVLSGLSLKSVKASIERLLKTRWIVRQLEGSEFVYDLNIK